MENQADVPAQQQDSPKTNVPILPKYSINQALQHLMGAIKRNPVTFMVSIAVSYILSGILIVLVFLGVASLLLGQFGLLFASVGKILMVLVVGLAVYTLLYALVYGFTLGCVAYSLGNEKLGIGTTLKKALQSTPRVVKVNAWVAVVAYWPIAIAAFLPLLLLSGQGLGNNPVATLLAPILILAACVWAIIAQLRYALAPYVALLEPDVPARQTLKRSEQLLKKGGQWFIFKGFLLILAVIIILGMVTNSNVSQLENSDDWSVNIILIVITLLVEGVMVMLYFNRASKQNAVTTPKSPRLAVAVIVLLISLLAFAAFSSKNAAGTESLSQSELEAYSELQQSSIDSTVKPVASTAPTQQPASPTGKTQAYEVFYRIAADGKTAQASPVLGKFTDVSSVEITVNLQCLGTCQFKLVSDNYTFSDTVVYTSSQKIKYVVTKPGEWTFRNQFTPTAFLVKF